MCKGLCKALRLRAAIQSISMISLISLSLFTGISPSHAQTSPVSAGTVDQFMLMTVCDDGSGNLSAPVPGAPLGQPVSCQAGSSPRPIKAGEFPPYIMIDATLHSGCKGQGLTMKANVPVLATNENQAPPAQVTSGTVLRIVSYYIVDRSRLTINSSGARSGCLDATSGSDSFSVEGWDVGINGDGGYGWIAGSTSTGTDQSSATPSMFDSPIFCPQNSNSTNPWQSTDRFKRAWDIAAYSLPPVGTTQSFTTADSSSGANTPGLTG